MTIDCLVAEIGSTTTLLNAFQLNEKVEFLGSALASTTVDTDVREGLKKALKNLEDTLNTDSIEYETMFAASSAAGGLKMSVSGLVYEMTVKAAKEAASNAGANIHLITAGHLEDDDLEQINDLKPNIILVSGGTDYGERSVALNNLKKIEQLKLNTPLIYAGNMDNHYAIKKYFSSSDQKEYLSIVENVYPRVDFMNIHPLRKKIYETFEKHIVHAKGMAHIKDMVDGAIMPTPGSVMESTMLLKEILGNVMVIDVGGATTDVHSIAPPSEEFAEYLEGEPFEKRTVEGDLGVFINYRNVIEKIGNKLLARLLNIDEDALIKMIDNYQYKPETNLERQLVFELTKKCVFDALDRHIGDLRNVYTTSGQKIIPDGRDLTQIQHIVLTGGALVHLKNTENIIMEYMRNRPKKLIPKAFEIYKDYDYIMSSVGVLSLKYPSQAASLLEQSLKRKR